MINTLVCLALSFLLSAVTATLLVSKIALLMVLKLIVASALAVWFIWSVTRYGRKPLWIVLGLAVITTIALTFLSDRLRFDAGYVPFAAGYMLSMNILVVGETAHRICRATNPQRAIRVTVATTLSGLMLGWLIYFYFFFLSQPQ